jgi:hypothetical protein
MSTPSSVLAHTSIRCVEADGVTVFYREAGPANARSYYCCMAFQHLRFNIGI